MLGIWSCCDANFSEFDTYTAQLKTPTDRRQTSWLLTKLCKWFQSGYIQYSFVLELDCSVAQKWLCTVFLHIIIRLMSGWI